MDKKQILKKIAINFIAVLMILLTVEFVTLILKTKNDMEYEHKLKAKDFQSKTTKISIKEFLKYMLFEIDILYFYDTDNNYFRLSEFRKPSVGKNYKNENIIVAGCSFAHVACVNDNETISAVLAEKFPKYKVYNIGLCGGSPRETLYILRNSQKYQNWNILPENKNDTKFFIFVYIKDHKRRLEFSIRPDSPHFKVIKSKEEGKKLDFYTPFKDIQRTFTVKYILENQKPSDIMWEHLRSLLLLYFKEIQREVKTQYPNAQFVIYDYHEDLRDNIKELEKYNIKVISRDKDYCKKEYVTFDDFHPNKRAWEEITDYLNTELNF